MKKSWISLFISVLFILCCQTTIAQTAQIRIQDCYTIYKNKGDAYNKDQKYDQAMEQYKIAKNCNYLSNYQTRTLDSLIESINKRLRLTNKSVIKRTF